MGTNEPSRQYTGQIKDGTGLYYYGARYYDPELGRFISPDSFLDGLNRYAYCRNNPVRYVDPTGNETDAWGNFDYGNFCEGMSYLDLMQDPSEYEPWGDTVGYRFSGYTEPNKTGNTAPAVVNPPKEEDRTKKITDDLKNLNQEIVIVIFLHDMADIVGAPYIWGSQEPETKLSDGNIFSNRDEEGGSIGHDCCGGVFFNIRLTAAQILRVDSEELTRVLPIMTQNELVNRMNKGEFPFFRFVDEKAMKPGDLIVVDLFGTIFNEEGKVTESYEKGVYEHIMVYAGKDFINRHLGHKEGKTFNNIKGAALIQKDTNVISTTGLQSSYQGKTPDVRVGCNFYTGAINLAAYKSGFEIRGINVEFTIIRIDWNMLFDEYNSKSGK